MPLAIVTVDPQDASNPAKASHHWYPFLRYQQECEQSGKIASVDDWMRSTGKLKDRINFEDRKAAATVKEET